MLSGSSSRPALPTDVLKRQSDDAEGRQMKALPQLRVTAVSLALSSIVLLNIVQQTENRKSVKLEMWSPLSGMHLWSSSFVVPFPFFFFALFSFCVLKKSLSACTSRSSAAKTPSQERKGRFRERSLNTSRDPFSNVTHPHNTKRLSL